MSKKTGKLFYSTKETAELLGIAPSTVTYWMREFDLKVRQSGSVSKLNKGKSYQFSQDNLRELEAIRLLVHEEGKSIERAKEELKQKGSPTEQKAEILTRLRSCLARLEELKTALDERKG